MNPPLRDPFLQVLSEQLADSGYTVSVHASDDPSQVDWLESRLPGCFGGDDVSLRWLSLVDQSVGEDEEQDDDDEPLRPLALVRIDALIPFSIDSSQWALTMGAIEMLNDLLPFGSVGVRPQAQCWAWQYTLASPADTFNGLLALRVIDTLQFYLELLSPSLIAAFERRDDPEALREAIRQVLAGWAGETPAEGAGARR
jgi:hypothetical protein